MYSYYQSNKVFLHLICLIIAFPLVFWADTQTFIKAWSNNTTYSHGFFIFPISLWLLYRKRHVITSIETNAEPRALLLFAFVLLLWFLSNVISVNVTQQFALVALIPLSIWAVFGHRLLLKILFPLGFLFFMIPIGASLIPPLMEITADITVSLVEVSGIPVYRDGLFFTLPTGNWSVVEACSGLNYLVASLTLGMLYSYLAYRTFKKRLVFVVTITAFALIANGLRAYGIVVIGHLSNMQYGTGGDHEFYGWLFYGFFVFWVFYLGNIWADNPVSLQEKPTKGNLSPASGNSPIVIFLAIITGMISVQVIAYQLSDFEETAFDNHRLELPEHFGGWTHSPFTNLGWKPRIEGASITKSQSYSLGNDIVQVSLGYYPWQTQESEAISWRNQIVDRSKQKWVVAGNTNLTIGDYNVSETEIYQQKNKLLVWNWYVVGNWQTPNPSVAKMFDALNIILYQRNDASFLTLATPIISDKLDSRKNLEAFSAEAREQIHEILSSVILEGSSR